MPTDAGPRRLLQRLSGARAGEGATAVLLALNLFILLTAYSILKVVREPLIQAAPRGPELKTYSAAGQALLLVVLVPAYGVIARRVPRRRLINLVTAFFVACLAGFSLLRGLHVAIGVPFYVWLGVFNLMIVAQFWAFANDLYTTEEGQRLFPIVALGGSVGAVTGSLVTGVLLKPLGFQSLFLVAAALLVVATLITNLVDARERRRTEARIPDAMTSGQLPAATPQIRAETGEFRIPDDAYRRTTGQYRALGAPEPPPAGAFGMVRRNRYLLLIALMMLLLNVVNSTGEYVLASTLRRVAADTAARTGGDTELLLGGFYAGYQTTVNVLSLVLQSFVVGRVIRWFGVSAALFVLPAIAFGGYAIMAFVPILAAIRWAKIAENATDYSLQNTVRQALFLPTTREEKYAAKQAIDGFFVRMGDVVTAGLVAANAAWLGLGARSFALANLALILAWMTLAAGIGRRYRALAVAA